MVCLFARSSFHSICTHTSPLTGNRSRFLSALHTPNEDGTKRVSKTFSKEGLAYAMARINLRYKTLAKMAPRKWGDEGHGLGEPAPAVESPRNGDDARNMGNRGALDQHPAFKTERRSAQKGHKIVKGKFRLLANWRSNSRGVEPIGGASKAVRPTSLGGGCRDERSAANFPAADSRS
jgi:hypothetical protein